MSTPAQGSALAGCPTTPATGDGTSVWVPTAPAAMLKDSKNKNYVRMQLKNNSAPTSHVSSSTSGSAESQLKEQPLGMGSKSKSGKRKYEEMAQETYRQLPQNPNRRGPKEKTCGVAYQAVRDNVWTAPTQSINRKESPWKQSYDPGSTKDAHQRLHEELWHLNEFLIPTQREIQNREELVNRLKNYTACYHKGYRIEAFGSYAAGLWLSTSDIDMVMYSPVLVQNPVKSECVKMVRYVFRNLPASFARMRQRRQIPFARVPIVKFIDQKTHVNVDISFNNNGGRAAIQKCREWMNRYSHMRTLVFLIKLYLKQQHLDDPAQGGLGGYTVCCLVTFALDHRYPEKIPDDLGVLLLDFFELYGNRDKFDPRTTGIDMCRMTMFQKADNKQVKQRPLVIIDPNNETNNIANASDKAHKVFVSFKATYDVLQFHLKSDSSSIIEAVYKGDYSSTYRMRSC